MATYLIYRNHDISAARLSRVRKIGEAFGIEGARTMTRADLRQLILLHPMNQSPIPHPLINVPVDLT